MGEQVIMVEVIKDEGWVRFDGTVDEALILYNNVRQTAETQIKQIRSRSFRNWKCETCGEKIIQEEKCGRFWPTKCEGCASIIDNPMRKLLHGKVIDSVVCSSSDDGNFTLVFTDGTTFRVESEGDGGGSSLNVRLT